MRVIFLTIYPETAPSTRFRVHQYLPLFAAAGIRCTFSPSLPVRLFRATYGRREPWRRILFFILAAAKRLGDVAALPFHDAVVVQKGIMPFRIRGAAALVRLLSRRLIYDFDDAVHLDCDTRLPRPIAFLEDRREVERLIRSADAVTAGNRSLEEYARRYNRSVAVVPTSVDMRAMPGSRSRGRPIIGWIGSAATNRYVGALAPAMDAAARRAGAEVWICSSTAAGTGLERLSAPSRFLRWSAETEREFFESVDVGVMPLDDTVWERSKCGLKLLMYMANGTAAVASPVGVNREIVSDGANGFLAATEDEWERKLVALCENPALRARIGAAGRATVAERYDLRTVFPLFARAIEGSDENVFRHKFDGDLYDRDYYEGKGKSSYCGGYEADEHRKRFVPIVDYIMWRFGPKRMMDVGCAKGYFVEMLRERGVEAFGADISGYAVSRAPERVRPFLRVLDIEREPLPFPDASFDGVAMVDILEHLVDYERAVREAARAVRPGGFVFIVAPDERDDHELDVSHVTIRERDFWFALFERHGFRALDERALKEELVDRRLAEAPAGARGRFLARLPGGRLARKAALRFAHRRRWKWMFFVREPDETG